MDSEVMYTLGQLTRCAFPGGAEPTITDVIVAKPATGLAKIMQSLPAQTKGEDFERLVNRLPADLSDPLGGVKVEDQGPFWIGYYHWLSSTNDARSKGPDELAEAGQALYGERWQTDLARDLGIADARRVRQWMTGDRPIPAGVWADIARLLRQRGLNAISLSGKLEK
jgi:hypothetical protein